MTLFSRAMRAVLAKSQIMEQMVNQMMGKVVSQMMGLMAEEMMGHTTGQMTEQMISQMEQVFNPLVTNSFVLFYGFSFVRLGDNFFE